MLLVGRCNVKRGRNIPLSLRNRAAGDAVDSGNTSRTVFKTKEKRNEALERVRTDREADGRTDGQKLGSLRAFWTYPCEPEPEQKLLSMNVLLRCSLPSYPLN